MEAEAGPNTDKVRVRTTQKKSCPGGHVPSAAQSLVPASGVTPGCSVQQVRDPSSGTPVGKDMIQALSEVRACSSWFQALLSRGRCDIGSLTPARVPLVTRQTLCPLEAPRGPRPVCPRSEWPAGASVTPNTC